MKVIEYIRNNGLEQLKEKYGIKVREYDDRIVLNYHQIDSPKFDTMVQECRGLILSWPDLEIMSRSFDRFFNYGEGSTPKKLDLSEYQGFEKIDGSLINFYWDGNTWCASTRGMAFAEGNCQYSPEKTFKDVIEQAAKCSVEEFCKSFDKNRTYIYELTSPETRVVKPYNEDRLYLLAIRKKVSETVYSPIDSLKATVSINRENMSLPKMYSFDSIENCIEACKELPGFDEGYVLYNRRNHHRLKVKNPVYLAIAHLRGDGVLSEKRIAILVFMQEYQEYLTMFPEDKRFFDPYIEAYDKLKEEINNVWEESKDIEDQKDFALRVKDTKVKTFMFNMRKGKTFSEIIEKMTDNGKLETLQGFIK